MCVLVVGGLVFWTDFFNPFAPQRCVIGDVRRCVCGWTCLVSLNTMM